MADGVSDGETRGQEEHTSPWLKATPADLEGLDFESPIAGSAAADCHELSDLYRSASQAATNGGDDTNDPARVRVWDLLSGLAGLHLKPEDGAVSPTATCLRRDAASPNPRGG